MEDLRGHVAKKVSHKPHLFFDANGIDAHKLQSWRALLHAPSEFHDENDLLHLPIFLML